VESLISGLHQGILVKGIEIVDEGRRERLQTFVRNLEHDGVSFSMVGEDDKGNVLIGILKPPIGKIVITPQQSGYDVRLEASEEPVQTAFAKIRAFVETMANDA
jgi:hypothetical protein